MSFELSATREKLSAVHCDPKMIESKEEGRKEGGREGESGGERKRRKRRIERKREKGGREVWFPWL